MKRLTVLFFSVFFLFVSIPTVFAGGRERSRRIVEESRVTSRRIIVEESRRYRHRSPRYYDYGVSVHAQAGFYYEPYGPRPRDYQRYEERRVVVFHEARLCGLIDGLTLGAFDVCGDRVATAATTAAAVEIRKAELQRDIMLRGPGAFGGESGSIDFRGSHLGSGEMTVERGRRHVASIPRCSREILEKEGIGHSARPRLFEDRSGNLCYYGGE